MLETTGTRSCWEKCKRSSRPSNQYPNCASYQDTFVTWNYQECKKHILRESWLRCSHRSCNFQMYIGFARGVHQIYIVGLQIVASWLDRKVDCLPGRYHQENEPKVTNFWGHNRVLYDRWTGQCLYRMAPVFLALSALCSDEILGECATWVMCWKTVGLQISSRFLLNNQINSDCCFRFAYTGRRYIVRYNCSRKLVC